MCPDTHTEWNGMTDECFACFASLSLSLSLSLIRTLLQNYLDETDFDSGSVVDALLLQV